MISFIEAGELAKELLPAVETSFAYHDEEFFGFMANSEKIGDGEPACVLIAKGTGEASLVVPHPFDSSYKVFSKLNEIVGFGFPH